MRKQKKHAQKRQREAGHAQRTMPHRIKAFDAKIASRLAGYLDAKSRSDFLQKMLRGTSSARERHRLLQLLLKSENNPAANNMLKKVLSGDIAGFMGAVAALTRR